MEGMTDYKNYNEDRTKKICFHCKEMLDVSLFRVREKKSGRGKGKYINNTCKKCEAFLIDEYRATDKGIAAEIARRTKYVCKADNLPYDLDKDWILERLNEINWKCELTGLSMSPRKSALNREKPGTGFQWDSISVDRLDPKSGYIKSNIRFVLNQINVFRQDHTDDQMYMLAKALLDYKDRDEQKIKKI